MPRFSNFRTTLKTLVLGGAWLAQSEERATLDLRVASLSPTMGAEITQISK